LIIGRLLLGQSPMLLQAFGIACVIEAGIGAEKAASRQDRDRQNADAVQDLLGPPALPKA
jgi:inner membrane transporter RhtA